MLINHSKEKRIFFAVKRHVRSLDRNRNFVLPVKPRPEDYEHFVAHEKKNVERNYKDFEATTVTKDDPEVVFVEHELRRTKSIVPGRPAAVESAQDHRLDDLDAHFKGNAMSIAEAILSSSFDFESYPVSCRCDNIDFVYATPSDFKLIALASHYTVNTHQPKALSYLFSSFTQTLVANGFYRDAAHQLVVQTLESAAGVEEWLLIVQALLNEINTIADI